MIIQNEAYPQIALIGCGAIAENYYLPALARFPEMMEKLILVDPNQERVQMLAAQFKTKEWRSSSHDIPEGTKGVIIALPTYLHHPVSMDFLARGVPVLCEKPLAESASKAREMVDMANKTGTALATNYSQRLWAQFAKVKGIIADQSLGEPISIKYYVGEIFNWPTQTGFLFSPASSGRGVLLDRGAHILDHICWWLGGKPEVVSFKNDSFGGGEAVAHVKFKYHKCVGDVRLSWLSKFPCKFMVEFERGSIEGEVYYPQSILVRTAGGPQKRVSLISGSYAELGHKIVDNFIGVALGREEPLVPGKTVLDSVCFTDDCYAVASRFDMPWYEIAEVKND